MSKNFMEFDYMGSMNELLARVEELRQMAKVTETAAESILSEAKELINGYHTVINELKPGDRFRYRGWLFQLVVMSEQTSRSKLLSGFKSVGYVSALNLSQGEFKVWFLRGTEVVEKMV